MARSSRWVLSLQLASFKGMAGARRLSCRTNRLHLWEVMIRAISYHLLETQWLLNQVLIYFKKRRDLTIKMTDFLCFPSTLSGGKTISCYGSEPQKENVSEDPKSHQKKATRQQQNTSAEKNKHQIAAEEQQSSRLLPSAFDLLPYA